MHSDGEGRSLLSRSFAGSDLPALRHMVSRLAATAGLSEPRRQDLVLAVDDRGPGVRPADRDRVFEYGDTVNIETMIEKGLLKNTKADVKIIGTGTLKRKKLAVTVIVGGVMSGS